MAQIISFANNLDNKFKLKETYEGKEEDLIKYVESKKEKWFSSHIVDAFSKVINRVGFHMDLKDDYIQKAVNRTLTLIDKDIVEDIGHVFIDERDVD